MLHLFRPKIKHPDEQVRLKALEGIRELEKLMEVAASDSSSLVGLAAVRKISDEEKLLDVVNTAKKMDVILDAVGRIRNQNRLAQILLNHRNSQIMKAAFEGITDPRILEDIAQDHRYSIQARRIAIDNYADQSFLEDVSGSAEAPKLEEADRRRMAEEPGEGLKKKASDAGEKALPNTENIQSLLQRYGGDRIADAIGKFRGSRRAVRSLGMIARTATDETGRAVHYLLKALEHANPRIRVCALEELSTLKPDTEIDKRIEPLKNDPDPNVRKAFEHLQA